MNNCKERKGQKETLWGPSNPVWVQLEKVVAPGIIPNTMIPEVAFKLRSEYELMRNFCLFQSRLKSKKEIVEKKKLAAEDKCDLLMIDSSILVRSEMLVEVKKSKGINRRKDPPRNVHFKRINSVR